MSKVYVFRGSKEISKDQILEQLGLAAGSGRRPIKAGAPFPNSGVSRFLLPASDCEYTLNAVRAATLIIDFSLLPCIVLLQLFIHCWVVLVLFAAVR